MSISIERMIKEIKPENTVLLFGAGASLPSGAPSVTVLMDALSEKIGVSHEGYSFDEFCSLTEQKTNRKEIVRLVRQKFKGLSPTRGLLNIPLFEWNTIYTTNYDDLIERAYLKKSRPFFTYSSNFDFGNRPSPDAIEIYKLHGTLQKDLSDGDHSRLILTTEDNDAVEDYREQLFDKLKSDLAFNDLVIIGHSLSDPDLTEIVKRAVRLRNKSGGNANIFLLMYNEDENRASLHEARGIKVAFGGIDDFVAELTKAGPEQSQVYSHDPNIEVLSAVLVPITEDVAHTLESEGSNISAMYNGSPAKFADIKAGFTFNRSLTEIIVEKLASGNANTAIVLGSNGVGKTTLSRQVLINFQDKGYCCWVHNSESNLLENEWRDVANRLKEQEKFGVLFIDDAHNSLFEINKLAELLSADKNSNLKLVLCSSKNLWGPRLKSTSLIKSAEFFELSKLDKREIDQLISLTTRIPQIAPLVEKSFAGFSLVEKKRRLERRCERDFFVCLKNIFSNEAFDDIILREYADIPKSYRQIYKIIAALETMGVIVHRQLVMRLVKIEASQITDVLDNLAGIVEEYPLARRGSMFGWRGRHLVISGIITSVKFDDPEEFYQLIEKTVHNLMPTYDCELQSMKQLCSGSDGINKIPSVDRQNKLLRIMMSNAPSQRVPRHRLIRNLIGSGQFEDAETEIRLFSQDIGRDGPIARYRIRLLLERANNSQGLLDEDRAHLLNKAVNSTLSLLSSYGPNKHTLSTYGDVAIEIYRHTGDLSHYDDAMQAMLSHEAEVGDPEITNLIRKFDRTINGTQIKNGSSLAIGHDELVDD